MLYSLTILIQLTKGGIPLLVTVSTLTGFLIASGGSPDGLFPVCTGIFLLACGASALNEYQDRRIDAVMERTKSRPIARGAISPGNGLVISILLSLTGGGILLSRSGATPFLIGVSAFFMYNCLYTYLKRVSAFAFFPGAVIGALPPAVGWSAAGGDLRDPRIIAIAFFLFIWQVPHFLIILLRCRKDYEKAGLPHFTSIFSPGQVRRITSVWIMSTAVASLTLPLYAIIDSLTITFFLFAASLWLGREAVRFLKSNEAALPISITFLEINAFALAVLLLLSLDTLL